MTVNMKIEMGFSIGKYACHLLLGRPWQYDRRVMHHCFTNEFTFVHKDRKTTIAPLAPREVSEDQLKIKTEK